MPAHTLTPAHTCCRTRAHTHTYLHTNLADCATPISIKFAVHTSAVYSHTHQYLLLGRLVRGATLTATGKEVSLRPVLFAVWVYGATYSNTVCGPELPVYPTVAQWWFCIRIHSIVYDHETFACSLIHPMFCVHLAPCWHTHITNNTAWLQGAVLFSFEVSYTNISRSIHYSLCLTLQATVANTFHSRRAYLTGQHTTQP